MPTRLRKIRRQRATRYMGWGQVGQHRASGRRGGKGHTGFLKHKWTWTVKYDPSMFGKTGFRFLIDAPPGTRELKEPDLYLKRDLSTGSKNIQQN